jgi:hypothetical protein
MVDYTPGQNIDIIRSTQAAVYDSDDWGSLRVSLANDNASNDAFQRLRISSPQTLFDSKQLHDNQPLFWDDQELVGSGTTSSHYPDRASSILGVSATTSGTRARQTFQRFNYQPGKSQLVFMTGVVDKSGGGTGITRSVGAFDANNGIFFKDDEGTNKFVIRSSVSGSPVDTEVAQANWNVDKLDGTGTSGYTLDVSKAQIMVFDYEWLGVGRVRCGFVIDGKIIYAHEFLHANVETGVYMSTPNLPLRYEIANDGTGAASELEHICSSVISEGGQDKTGSLRHTDGDVLSSLSSGSTYAVIGIKLKSTHLDAVVNVENISMLCSTANDFAHWELILNPTVAGTSFTYSDESNSAIQVAFGDNSTTTVSGGTKLDGGYFSTDVPTLTTVPNSIRIGSDLSGSADELVLCVTPVTNNIGVYGSLTWRELS